MRLRLTSVIILSWASLTMLGCSSLRLQDPGPDLVFDPPSSIAWPLEQDWSYDASAGFGLQPLIRSGRFLLIGNRRGEVHAVDHQTGRRAGKHEFGDSVEGRPVVSGSILVVPVKIGGASVQALNLSTGKILWRHSGEPVEAGLLTHHDRVVAADIRGTITSIDIASGDIAWEVNPSESGYLTSPVQWNDHLIVVDTEGTLSVLDPSSGATVWQLMLDRPVHRDPLLAGGFLIVPTTRGSLFMIDLAEQEVAWNHSTQANFIRFGSPVLMDEHVVLAGSDGVVRAFQLSSGDLTWKSDIGASVSAPPLIAGDSAIIGTMDSRLVLLDTRTGHLVGEQETRGRVKSAMAADAEGLLIAVEPSHVVRYRW